MRPASAESRAADHQPRVSGATRLFWRLGGKTLTTTGRAYHRETSLKLLEQTFGHSSFRHGQEEIIQSIVEGRDTLAVMPTGGGKSLCYQLPALLCPGIALVVSPLIALMQDQVDSLQRVGVAAEFINSTLGAREIRRRLNSAQRGELKMLYLAPERLASRSFLAELHSLSLSFLAVDEAHCISEWGHDFRPSYHTLADVNDTLGRLPLIALTATATPEVRKDIAARLRMQEPRHFVRGFDRPNLRFNVEKVKVKTPRVLDICVGSGGSNIIYCGSRKRVDEMTRDLKAYKLTVASYHAGLSDTVRKKAQDEFSEGKVTTIVATNAFGMGVDKSNVRNVIHCDLPLTLEAYYQEAGRAGRDGKPSDCTILYDSADRNLPMFFLQCSHPERSEIEDVYGLLYDVADTGVGTRAASAVYLDEAQIGNRLGMHRAKVGTILALLERDNIIRRSGAQGQASLQFAVSRARLEEYHRHTPDPIRKAVLVALVRSIGAEALERPVEFDPGVVARKYNLRYDDVTAALHALEYARMIRYERSGARSGLTLLAERSRPAQIPIDWELVNQRRDHAFKKFFIVMRYVSAATCKRDYLLEYFGETAPEKRCGICTSCRARAAKPKKRSKRDEFLLHSVLSGARDLDGRFGRNMLASVLRGEKNARVLSRKLQNKASFGLCAEFSQKAVLAGIDGALADGLLRQTTDLRPTVELTTEGRGLLPALVEKSTGGKTQRTGAGAASIRDQTAAGESADDLLLSCRTLRVELASRKGVAPRAIIDDATLEWLVSRRPTTRAELSAVNGIGPLFVSRYGDEFLRLLRGDRQADTAGIDSLPRRLHKLAEAATAGEPLEAISRKIGVEIGIAARGIQELLERGVKLKRGNFVGDELFHAVGSYLNSNPTANIKEVRREIEVQSNPAEVRLAMAFVRVRRSDED